MASIVCIFIIVGIAGCIDNEGNQSPIVDITVDPIEGFQPLSVLFRVNATDPDGTIQSYQWNFDDGTLSNLQNVSHTFYYGEYEVVITVIDDEGSNTSKKVTVMVHNQPPTISISAYPITGFPPLKVYFDGNSNDIDGNISYYHWDFKDNHTSDMENPSHIYQTPGQYNVSCTIIDNDGAMAADQVTILVKEGPIMTMKENIQNYVEKTDNTTKVISGDYQFFDEGDKIIIRDIIYEVSYDQTAGISYLEFESFPGYPLPFEGDISYKFQPGDRVDLTVHILMVSFQEIIDNEIWTVTLETFKEGWDTTDNSLVPIPQKYLTKTV